MSEFDSNSVIEMRVINMPTKMYLFGVLRHLSAVEFLVCQNVVCSGKYVGRVFFKTCGCFPMLHVKFILVWKDHLFCCVWIYLYDTNVTIRRGFDLQNCWVNTGEIDTECQSMFWKNFWRDMDWLSIFVEVLLSPVCFIHSCISLKCHWVNVCWVISHPFLLNLRETVQLSFAG